MSDIEFKPKSGKLIKVNELGEYLSKFSNIEFDCVDIVNMLTNTEGGISGGSSTTLQLIGTRDDDDILILTMFSNGTVWALCDNDSEDEYRFEEYPEYICKYSNDILQENINWKDYGCNNDDDSCIKKFLEAVKSITEEGVESDSINEFEDEYETCSPVWSQSTSEFDEVPEEAEDDDYWTYAGFLNIFTTELIINVENNMFVVNSEEYGFDEIYNVLTDKIENMAWDGEDGTLVGAGLLQKKI